MRYFFLRAARGLLRAPRFFKTASGALVAGPTFFVIILRQTEWLGALSTYAPSDMVQVSSSENDFSVEILLNKVRWYLTEVFHKLVELLSESELQVRAIQ